LGIRASIASLLDFVFVLVFCALLGLCFNIVGYLWFSAVALIVFGSGSLFGWLGILLGFQLSFYFYLFRLEQHYFFTIFSKAFYVGLLVCVNAVCGNMVVVLGYLGLIFSSVSYLLMGRAYFYSCSILGSYFFSFLLVFIYCFTLHEFGFFGLLIGFPLSLIFFLKFAFMSGGCVFLFFLFLLPLLLATQVGRYPVYEELLVCFFLGFLFI